MPSEELENLARHKEDENDGLSQSAIQKICEMYELNTHDVTKYKRLG